MKRYYSLICLALLLDLYIYTIYRTNQQVVNVLLKYFWGSTFIHTKAILYSFGTPPPFVRYSLPGGLWAFAATLLARRLYFRRLPLAILPLVYIIFLEILQYFHLTDGTFDVQDVVTSTIFTLLAFFVPSSFRAQQVTQPPFWRIVLFVLPYTILYLADCWS